MSQTRKTVVFQSAAVATGNGTQFVVNPYGLATFSVTGTFVGSFIPEGSHDMTNWFTVDPIPATGGITSGALSTTGMFRCVIAGLEGFRVRISAFTSGSITIQGVFELEGDPGSKFFAVQPVDLRRNLTNAFAVIDTAVSGDNTIVAASAGNKVKVTSYALVCDGTVAVRWKSGAATNLSGAMSFVANTGIAPGVSSPGQTWLFETAAGAALVLNLSAAIGVRGHLSYFLEA